MIKLQTSSRRSGFTLTELLIVISIVLLLMTMTVMSVRFVNESDRVSGAARQVQSFLSGARDRALYRRTPIGVRLFLDVDSATTGSGSGERRTVSAMAYIDPGKLWDDGHIRMMRFDSDLDGRTDSADSDGDGSADLDINGDGILDNPSLIWVVQGSKVNKWWEMKRPRTAQRRCQDSDSCGSQW